MDMGVEPVRSRRSACGNHHLCISAHVLANRYSTRYGYMLLRVSFYSMDTQVFLANQSQQGRTFPSSYTMVGTGYGGNDDVYRLCILLSLARQQQPLLFTILIVVSDSVARTGSQDVL